MNNKNTTTLAAIFTIAVLALGTMQFAAAGGDDIKLEGEFTGDATASGKAKFELRDDGRMKFNVQAEDLPDGDYTVTVSRDATFSETRTAVLGMIDLDMDTNLEEIGDDPLVLSEPLQAGDVVTISGPITLTATLQEK